MNDDRRFPPRPRIVREFEDVPTANETRSTRRPGSKPDVLAEDANAMLGKVMASVALLGKKFESLNAAWDVRSQEHETAMRELTMLGKCVRDMREDMQKTGKQVATATRVVAPGL